MRRLSTYAVALAFVPFWACAGAQSEDSGDQGTGGNPSSTGGQAASGGSSNHSGGNSNHSGGASSGSGGSASGTGGVTANQTSTGGGANSGGSASTGGTVSTGGAASTGGASSGGTSSGGAGTGGATYEGDCADKPTWAVWHTSPDAASGDLVIFACTKSQSECTAAMVGEDYLFECTDTHTNNCKTQKPEDGSAWNAIDSCENLGFGGMGGGGP